MTTAGLKGIYGRGLLLAIGIWSVHFWIVAAAFVWLPVALAVVALPVIMGSAVILVWRLERQVKHRIQVSAPRKNLWVQAERNEPSLPQPEQGWTWQHIARQTEQRELAEKLLRRNAA